MSEECKYCKTSQTCLEMADYGSFYCLLHREIPRVIEKTYEELQQENQELKEQLSNSHQIKNKQKEFIDWLENEIKGCHNYSKYIENKLQELKSRSAGKTYIANEIMKNEVAKKCFTKILSKYKEIIGKDINVSTKEAKNDG